MITRLTSLFCGEQKIIASLSFPLEKASPANQAPKSSLLRSRGVGSAKLATLALEGRALGTRLGVGDAAMSWELLFLAPHPGEFLYLIES